MQRKNSEGFSVLPLRKDKSDAVNENSSLTRVGDSFVNLNDSNESVNEM